MSDEIEVTVETSGDETPAAPAPDRWAEVMSAIGDLGERVGRLEAAQDRTSEAVATEAAEAATEAAEAAQDAAAEAITAAIVTESVAEETAEDAAEAAAAEVVAETAEATAEVVEAVTEAPPMDTDGGDVESREWEEPGDSAPSAVHPLYKPIKLRRRT